jgi:hypothetical protein
MLRPRGRDRGELEAISFSRDVEQGGMALYPIEPGPEPLQLACGNRRKTGQRR